MVPDRRAGELFVGQCAEYCGSQHANMLLRVQVDSPEDFDRWWKHEQENAKPPANNEKSEVRDGRRLFLSQSCVNCHAIRGTSAKGPCAPDLTHLMRRETLASGMIANDRAGKNLHAWVKDPQKIKPGCLMPAFGLSDKELDKMIDYLLTLD